MSSSTLEGKAQKGAKLLEEGKAAESREDYDSAVELYEKALAASPGDPACTLALRRAAFEASQRHVARGRKLRDEGRWGEAVAEFQKAVNQDPSSSIAMQEWLRTSEQNRRVKAGEAPAADGGLTPGEKAQRDAASASASMAGLPVLRPMIPVISSLKMNNQPPKVVYETIGKLAGVTVIFDSQSTAPSRGLNVELSGASVEQAFDHVALLTKTYWKPVSQNTIFVTEDNPAKRRDYEDNVAKVFYVHNTTSVQEFQELVTAIRSLTEIRRVFSYNAQKAILVRGTPDQVALAGRLILDLDKTKAEVLVDVIVLQANSSRTRTIAAQLGSSSGLSMSAYFNPRNAVSVSTSSTSDSTSTTTTTTSTAVSLANLGRISTGDFATTLPGALLNLVMSDSRTRVLQSPQVRASDGQKVTLKIGQKVPYATGSYSSTVTTTTSSLVNTQFNYADVGVNVDLTPQVHSSKEVTLKVTVEISSVASHVTIGGISQPVIAQQKGETEIRMREGEVNILSGLSSSSDSKSISGIPGLVDLPVLGRALGGETTDKEGSELLIALVPHIIRMPEYSEDNLREVSTGTDQVVRVTYSRPDTPSNTQPPGSAPPPAVASEETNRPPEPNAGTARLTFSPGSVSVTAGGAIQVSLRADGFPRPGGELPVIVKFDPKLMRLEAIAEGELVQHWGSAVTRNIRNDTGDASLTIGATQSPDRKATSGVLATLTFTAIGKGTGVVSATGTGSSGPTSAPAAELSIVVK